MLSAEQPYKIACTLPIIIFCLPDLYFHVYCRMLHELNGSDPNVHQELVLHMSFIVQFIPV